MAEQVIIESSHKGGQGVDASNLFDPHHIRETTRLAERAIREEWPIDFETRKLVIDKMKDILSNAAADERNQIGAGKVIISADMINAKRQTTAQPQQHLHGKMDDATQATANQVAKDALDASDLVAAAGLLDSSRVGVASNGVHKNGSAKQLDTA